MDSYYLNAELFQPRFYSEYHINAPTPLNPFLIPSGLDGPAQHIVTVPSVVKVSPYVPISVGWMGFHISEFPPKEFVGAAQRVRLLFLLQIEPPPYWAYTMCHIWLFWSNLMLGFESCIELKSGCAREIMPLYLGVVVLESGSMRCLSSWRSKKIIRNGDDKRASIFLSKNNPLFLDWVMMTGHATGSHVGCAVVDVGLSSDRSNGNWASPGLSQVLRGTNTGGLENAIALFTRILVVVFFMSNSNHALVECTRLGCFWEAEDVESPYIPHQRSMPFSGGRVTKLTPLKGAIASRYRLLKPPARLPTAITFVSGEDMKRAIGRYQKNVGRKCRKWLVKRKETPKRRT